MMPVSQEKRVQTGLKFAYTKSKEACNRPDKGQPFKNGLVCALYLALAIILSDVFEVCLTYCPRLK